MIGMNENMDRSALFGSTESKRSRSESQVKLTENSAHDTNGPGMSKEPRSVLVVDDDPIVLAVAEERLAAMGFEVTTRDQVLGTSQWIVQNQPWLILLDIMMPAMSGSELASFLRRRGIVTHIVLHSSKDSSELQRLVRSTGALGAIPKGLDDAQFEALFTSLARTAESQGGFPAGAP